ncbi:phosphatidylglycerophosphatase A family protein [Flavisolibacter ginsengisoli]|jgi:phosphatidylglycerophosphatase A|uniref:Phosphatidylglycerophosphatase A n=1 Tax=Flavisolibacter ginsengisoli DSM 18119 TaxID=1121884 RepID=A0A1M4U5I5_9BACT|nr:phosphatidylglycerophosphatase A [Flavisolibacter ginsengisoli]SHE51928.1 phosphatidylglycerophosphatase A [Flavisolibacter ginsengisoli DSM 18119]
MIIAKLISTCLGIGYIRKGAGTVAAFIGCIAWYFIQVRGVNALFDLITILVITIFGIWSASVVEIEWGKDSNRVVIDELLGMCISLFLIPAELKYIALAFVFFRFFDIVKPLYIRKAEVLPGGWGVMADDVLAGIYSNILLHIVVKMSF